MDVTKANSKRISRGPVKRPWQENLSVQKHTSSFGEFDLDHKRLDLLAEALGEFGRIYNEYSIVGADQIPRSGPALIVLNRGVVPLDAWYFFLEHYRRNGRMIRVVCEDFVFSVPGLRRLAKITGAVPRRASVVRKLLESGHLVAISPPSFLGQAKLVIETDVPVIPVFTQNVESMYRSLITFPVSLTSFVGKPLVPHQGESAEQLASRIKTALASLLQKHQAPRQSLGQLLSYRVNRFLSRAGSR